MLTHVALAVGLLAISADPTTTTTRQVPRSFETTSAQSIETGAGVSHDGGLVDEDCGDQTYHGADV